MFVLFLCCFAVLTQQTLTQDTRTSCGKTEVFNVLALYAGGTFATSVRGCLTDQNIIGVRLQSNVYTFEANTFVNMLKLDRMFMSNKEIHNLKPGFIKNAPNLRNIYASENRIRRIENGVFNNLNLEHLNLSSNIIDRIYAGAFANVNASQLNLSRNKLPQVFVDCFHESWIKELDLSYNRITIIHAEAFKGLMEPEIINLSHNKIVFVEDDTFSAPVALKSLLLSWNNLKGINFLRNAEIKFLDISFNVVNRIGMVQSMKIGEIVIYPNPWNCKYLMEFWKYAWQYGIFYSGQWKYAGPKLEELKTLPVCLNKPDKEDVYQEYFQIVEYEKYNM